MQEQKEMPAMMICLEQRDSTKNEMVSGINFGGTKMKRLITIFLIITMVAGCATTGNTPQQDQQNIAQNTGTWCLFAQGFCDAILVVGGIAAIYTLVKSKGKSDDDVAPPAVPSMPLPTAPTNPVSDGRVRMIIDTDMGPRSDPDDVQTYLAQASDLSRWDVRGIVSTGYIGAVSGVTFIQAILSRLSNEVSTQYQQYPVTADPQFYVNEIEAAHRDGAPLEIHVWGSLRNLVTAINRIGDKENRLSQVTVYWVANFNRFGRPEYTQAWNQMIERTKGHHGYPAQRT